MKLEIPGGVSRSWVMFLPNFEIFLIFLNFLRYFLWYKISDPVFLVVNQTSTETVNCQNIMTKVVLKAFMSILCFWRWFKFLNVAPIWLKKGKSIQNKPFINQFWNASNNNFWLKPNAKWYLNKAVKSETSQFSCYLSNTCESPQNYAKYQDIDYLEETETSYMQKNSAGGWQNISQKVNKTLLPKIHFCSGDWRAAHVCIQCLDFPNISWFFKIQIFSLW